MALGKHCSVCYLRFTALSEGVRGCPVHGIRKPAKINGKLIAKEVLKWAASARSGDEFLQKFAPLMGGTVREVNPYALPFVRLALVYLGEKKHGEKG